MVRGLLLLYARALANAGGGADAGNRAVADDHELAAPAEHPDSHAAAEAERAMTGRVTEDPHLRLTPLRNAHQH